MLCLWCAIVAVVCAQAMVATTLTAWEDWKIVTYENLHMMDSTRMFERHDIVDYSRFGLDLSGGQIIVGVRDHLLRLRLSDLDLLEIAPWLSDAHTVNICLSKGQSKEDCHNFIRVLFIQQDRVLVCGTNSYSPQCSWRKLESLNLVESWFTGVAKCPYSPHQNNTSVLTSDGDFYSATVTDFTGRDAAIYRMIGPSRQLRTAQYNSRWLNEPDFVSAYEIGDYVYFFFREVAVEYINCGKVIYSRVARICKGDSGGKVFMADNWSTFLKARLNCSLPGNYPFYFSELQSTYYDEDLQLIFAVFTTSPTSIYGSAVCIYNMTSFDQAFSGSFKYQENAQSAWTRASNNRNSLQCSRGTGQEKRSSEKVMGSPRHLVDIQKFQMMDSAVQPTSHIPPLLMENERWSHIAVDRVHVLFQSVHTEVIVLFMATLEGVIKKYFLLPQPISINGTNVSVCFLEALHLMPMDQIQPIRQMELVRTRGFLLIGTATRLYQIPTQRCRRFYSKILCQSMQDPYCDWNDEAQECQAIGNGNLTSCPQPNFAVDGEWSTWSPWQQCSSPPAPGSRNNGSEEQSCVCRSRACDNPPPRNGGQPCLGQAMQVINCTGNSEKQDSEMGGQWSAWSEWTPCSSTCGDGQQKRVRSCRKSIDKKKSRCSGAKTQIRVCSLKICEEIHRSYTWSRWYVTELGNSGFREERLRCDCDAKSSDKSSGKLSNKSFDSGQQDSHFVTDFRFCSVGKQNCSDSENRLNISMPSHVNEKCEKRTTGKVQENTVAKQEPLTDPRALGQVEASSRATNRRITQRSSFPAKPSVVFYGYCGCRDLGMFRICHKCNIP